MNPEVLTLIEEALGKLADADVVLRRDARRAGWRDPHIEAVTRAEAILEAVVREHAVAAAGEGGDR